MTPYPVALTSHDLAEALRAMLAHRFGAFKSTERSAPKATAHAILTGKVKIASRPLPL